MGALHHSRLGTKHSRFLSSDYCKTMAKCFNRPTSRKVSLGTKELDFLTANTELKDREKLRFHFENFIAKHPKGKIGKKDFREMYKGLYPAKDCEKIMERMFKMYDKDNDGYIQFRELMVVIYVMSDGSIEDNLRQIFRVFDGNEDGTITLKEMKKFIRDINGNGRGWKRVDHRRGIHQICHER